MDLPRSTTATDGPRAPAAPDEHLTRRRRGRPRRTAAAGLHERVRPGQRVAITAGSRGIANIAAVIRTVAEEVRAAGAEPFVVPAMGSHGGATAEGQRRVLAEYGITEAEVGAPILATMDTVEVGPARRRHSVLHGPPRLGGRRASSSSTASRRTRPSGARSRAASARCSRSASASSAAPRRTTPAA